ncbi:hypothetical protein E2986_12958 [Frieseomelitta varia]|uniref:Uncharacterized protein n=1 Tax=Frieseomelitta varia TaxID=561572 RepID=A0A833SFJ0_9HYME|nr:hypothetical protein E2986_12958 [Frieseomelitta varia]
MLHLLYIEYTGAGIPLNWIEERKPMDGLPPDAKPLSNLTINELEFEDVARTARHVSVSWLEATASTSQAQPAEQHAVQLVADYCSCPYDTIQYY